MLGIKFADPISDIAFKKMFANHQHKEVLISFLNAVLERKNGQTIVEVEILDHHNISLIQELQATILDVRCTDQDGKYYIVEMQKKDRYDFPERCVFYASYVYAQQLTNKKPYKELTSVIFVGIINFNLFNGLHAISHYFICDSHELESIADKWIYLLKHAGDFIIVPQSLRKPEEIATALQLLSTHFWTRQDLDTYFRQMDQYRLALSDVETERLKLEMALEKGREEGIGKVAQQMLKEGLDVEFIEKVTGLSKEQIKKIRVKE